jgi:hypothetical protein
MAFPAGNKRKTEVELFEPPEYLLALGNFITRFADLEGLLNAMVWKLSGLDKRMEVAKAVFGPLAIDGALEKITRLITSRSLQRPETVDVDFMIPQIRAIASVRNVIMHRGYTDVKGNRFIFDNKQFTLKAGRKRISLGVNTLNQMSADVLLISRHLWLILFRSRLYRRRFEFLFGELRAHAWRYRPRSRSRSARGRRSGRPQMRLIQAPPSRG